MTDLDREGRPRLRLPRPDRIPNASNEREVPPIDTGGAFRPDWRKQNPASDPKEPYGGESASTGEEHGWSGCTMTAAALAYAYARGDASGPWGGDFRHHQSDLTGGTDLVDADEAFHNYGNENLDIRTGNGWADLKAKRAEGRAVVIQGEGNVPGTESFDGGHACCIGLETNSDGKWLWGDPLASGWQWVTESSIRDWAENLSSGIYFAVTKVAPKNAPSGGHAMSIVYRPERWSIPEGTDFYVSPGGAKIGDFSKAMTVTTLGPALDPNDSDGIDFSYRAVLVTTSAVDGASSRKIVWIARPAGDPVDNGTAEWDDSMWALAQDTSGRWPCPPGADCATQIEARDSEWESWLLAGSPGSTD